MSAADTCIGNFNVKSKLLYHFFKISMNAEFLTTVVVVFVRILLEVTNVHARSALPSLEKNVSMLTNV